MGVLDEAVALFDFAIQLARSVPEERFILRCHPVLPFSQVRPHLAQGPEGCANIEVSTAPEIAADFGRSSAALYHGSSAVLYAVLHGLRPLYLRTAALPDADPLFELQEWRVPVSSLEDAKRDLEAYAGLSAQQADLAWRKAYDYVQRYTKSVDDLSVDRFLAAVGMGQGVPS